MSWDTDWSNGVSETITEIQTIASNQVTDEAAITALQNAAAYVVTSTSTSLTVTSSGQGKFLKVYAAGSVTSGNVNVNIGSGLVIVGPFTPNGSNLFILEFTMYFDGTDLYVVKPGSNPQIAASSATSFSLSVTGTGVSISKFEAAGF